MVASAYGLVARCWNHPWLTGGAPMCAGGGIHGKCRLPGLWVGRCSVPAQTKMKMWAAPLCQPRKPPCQHCQAAQRQGLWGAASVPRRNSACCAHGTLLGQVQCTQTKKKMSLVCSPPKKNAMPALRTPEPGLWGASASGLQIPAYDSSGTMEDQNLPGHTARHRYRYTHY